MRYFAISAIFFSVVFTIGCGDSPTTSGEPRLDTLVVVTRDTVYVIADTVVVITRDTVYLDSDTVAFITRDTVYLHMDSAAGFDNDERLLGGWLLMERLELSVPALYLVNQVSYPAPSDTVTGWCVIAFYSEHEVIYRGLDSSTGITIQSYKTISDSVLVESTTPTSSFTHYQIVGDTLKVTGGEWGQGPRRIFTYHYLRYFGALPNNYFFDQLHNP